MKAERHGQDDWLTGRTGKSSRWWVATVQRLIKKHSSTSKDPKHDTTDVAAWLGDLIGVVQRYAPARRRYDGNMWAAAVLSQVLALWFLRVQRAKAWDPRRPLKLRRRAYRGWLTYTTALLQAAIDEKRDSKYFPGQRWESPFVPGAKDGGFR